MNAPLDLELHRDGLGLLSEAGDPDPGLAIAVAGERSGKGSVRMCSCAAAKRRMCGHQRRLAKLAKTLDDDHVRRLAFPFVLRRLKSAVLEELPEKIEDVRTAAPSEEQLRLYREAVARRGEALAREIARGDRPVPYMHVFALLDHLKQICNHPALALGVPEAAAEHESGKWDLFQELLLESLEAERKVVVFTQYLGMIAMMERLLEGLGIGFATLTGKTRDRAGAIARFEGDAGCRVFLGSLKAGGTGIDLVAGSVVIHYDRRWNAAREDQATDRVHRIGQRRSVQVFKLVTEGTGCGRRARCTASGSSMGPRARDGDGA